MEKILKFSNLAKVATIALVGSLLVGATPAQASPLVGEAKSVAASNSTERLSYIVVFQDGTNVDLEASRVRGLGGEVGFKYTNVFRGLSAKMNASQLRALANNPRVTMIEADGVVTTSSTTQNGATWGLDRIDQRSGSLNSTYVYTPNGTGVTAYVIDTGILSGNVEFGGRVKGPGFSAFSDGRGSSDCNGHGTHVAGTIGGARYGVAKNVDLVAVRVLDCNGSGSWSGVIAGMDWVVSHATTNGLKDRAVANMSLGGGASSSIDSAVGRLVSAGVTTVVAAGNSTADACTASPAKAPAAITVGATTSSGSMASYSNFGTCVDINAPGSSITSAWHTSTTAINTISGTSMASPHVAGVAALILSSGKKTPAQVDALLKQQATPNAISSVRPGTPNLLVFSNPTDGSAPSISGATISGTPKVGQVLTGSATFIAGNPTTTTTSYQWLAGGVAISGATSSTFTPTSAQVGQVISLRATVSNTIGSSSTVSGATAVVEPADTAPTVSAVTISGTPKVGQTLTGSATVVAGFPTSTTTSYQWLSGTEEISGATSSTFVPTTNEIDKTISLRVTVENTVGRNSALSSATSAVVAADSTGTAPTVTSVVISGTPTEGQTLTGSATINPGTGSDTTDTYEWLENGNSNVIATGQSLLLTSSHVGKSLILRVTVKNASGESSATSSATSAVVGLQSEVTPGTPVNFVVSSRNKNSIALSWRAPSSQITGYVLEVSRDVNFVNGVTSFDLAAAATGVTVQGLVSRTTYYFRLKAVNLSKSSLWVNITTSTR